MSEEASEERRTVVRTLSHLERSRANALHSQAELLLT